MIGDCRLTEDLIPTITREINFMDPTAFPPAQKLRPGEKELTVVSDLEIQKIFSTATFYMKACNEISVKQNFTVSDDEDKELEQQEVYSRFAKILMEMFWMACEIKLGLGSSRILGVRRGWVIVDRSNAPDYLEDQNPMRRFFGGMMPPMGSTE